MMYAMNAFGGYRAIDSASDLLEGETICEAPPSPVEMGLNGKAELVRNERDALLQNVYDRSVMILLRMQRIAPAEQQSAIAAKLAELDEYAVALQNVPEQPGFPDDIVWPTIPSKEL